MRMLMLCAAMSMACAAIAGETVESAALRMLNAVMLLRDERGPAKEGDA